MEIDQQAARKIPSLREWLGDGARADGFEEYVEAVLQGKKSPDPGVRASHRVIETLMIAMVEAGRREDAAGEQAVDTLLRMGRGTGFAFMSAMVSKVDDAMPLDEALEMATEMFREGAQAFITHHQTEL